MLRKLPRLPQLSIGQRLSAGFGILVVLLAAAAVLGVMRMASLNRSNQVLTDQQLPVLMDANAWIIGLLETSRHMQNIVLLNDPAAVKQELEEVRKNKAERKDLKKKLEQVAVEPAVAAALDGVMDARAAYLPSEDQFIQLVQGGDLPGARALLLGTTLRIQRAYIDQLYTFIAAGKAAVAAQRDSSVAAYLRGRDATLGLSAGAALLGVLIAWLITRSIIRPLHSVVAIADRVAAGRLDNVIPMGRRDETGRLLDSMRAMQTSLQGFVSAQGEMAARHAEGNMQFRMRAADFPGTYGEMAQAVNTLVESQIQVTTRLAEVIKAYAVGDFSVDLPALPGEQAQLTATCAEAKRNLLGIQSQIVLLSEAAARGDFSVRGDPGQFHNAFRDMVSQLNRMMEVCDASLADVSRMMAAIAAGDLTASIDSHYEGTFGRLKEDANRTARQLEQTVLEIRSATDALTAAATEIASRNRDLSSRTERQADLVRETASAMEQQTALVTRNAENARSANQLVEGASDVARRGGSAVAEVVGTMGGISESSRKISNIIGVINDIAFQTNILALNAAVEAARAGDQGRGFAVVAGEVRSLALRSATAAKEIKELIGDSVEKVESGTRQVSVAGSTMDDIVHSVKRVNDIVGGITEASLDQAGRIEEVNRYIVDMERATQQNARFVEEAAEATRAMEDLAASLGQAVAVFRVGEA